MPKSKKELIAQTEQIWYEFGEDMIKRLHGVWNSNYIHMCIQISKTSFVIFAINSGHCTT